MSNEARAIIDNDAIVISVPISYLPVIVEGAWASYGLDTRFKLTDASVFAKEMCRALNEEAEDGTTMIHLMFDKAINEALEQGAEGIEEHEDQDA